MSQDKERMFKGILDALDRLKRKLPLLPTSEEDFATDAAGGCMSFAKRNASLSPLRAVLQFSGDVRCSVTLVFWLAGF